MVVDLSRVFTVGMTGEVRKESILCGYLGKVESRLRKLPGHRLQEQIMPHTFEEDYVGEGPQASVDTK